MSTGIEKMVQLAKQNQGFKRELQGCKTVEEALSVLKANNINVTPEEFTQFTQSNSSGSVDTKGTLLGTLCFQIG